MHRNKKTSLQKFSELVTTKMVEVYGEDHINLCNCHTTAWMVFDLFSKICDLKIVLGVVLGYYPYPQERIGPTPILHCWVETPEFTIDPNPQVVANWTDEYWVDRYTAKETLNLKVSKVPSETYFSDLREAEMFFDVDHFHGYFIERLFVEAELHRRYPGLSIQEAVKDGWIVLDQDYK